MEKPPRASDVLTQFLSEALVLCLSGGLIGIALAFVTSLGLNKFTDVRTVTNPSIGSMAFFFAGAVGVFFGFYPARKAAGVNPIDALRHE